MRDDRDIQADHLRQNPEPGQIFGGKCDDGSDNTLENLCVGRNPGANSGKPLDDPGLGLFGAGIPIAGMLRAGPVLLLVALSFVPFGVVSAAFVILVKRGNPFSGPAHQLTLLLSGALYPLSVLPGWLEAVAKLVPATYGVRATRAIVQTEAGLTDVLHEIGVLAVFVVVALPLSMMAFRRAVGVAQRAGTLGTY